MRKLSIIPVGALVALIAATTAFAAVSDSLVSNGSPTGNFPQNKQNEPALAVDANHPNILVSGANDEIDLAPCNGTHCPFTPGIGVSGVYFSFDKGKSWMQPTYTGLSGRACVPNKSCSPAFGKIGTLPWYFENGLVADGDPALAFGPRLGSTGFSWANGSRLYYANLTSNFAAGGTEEAFKGFEAIAVSRTDHVAAAAASNKDAWMPPVLVSKQSSTTFSDKEQIWADNAASSPFFGNVYVCWADFRGQEKGLGTPAPMQVAVSTDGGDTWTQHQVGPAANNTQRSPMDGCTVRTDSHGNAYVFGVGSFNSTNFEYVTISTDGGVHWSTQQPVVGPVMQPGVFDSVLGRPTIDGIAGARSDLAIAPSVDIANGAPTGIGATNRIVMTFVSGKINSQHVYFTESPAGAANWSTPRAIETAGDYGYYTAPAISPNGSDVYVVYNAFTTKYQTDTSSPRLLVGVLLHAGPSGVFSSVHRGAAGDARSSSQNNLKGEFLGDYVYAVATSTFGAAVWNDSRGGVHCQPIDDWRMSLRTGAMVTRPAPLTDCPPTWGNSDIYAFTTAP